MMSTCLSVVQEPNTRKHTTHSFLITTPVTLLVSVQFILRSHSRKEPTQSPIILLIWRQVFIIEAPPQWAPFWSSIHFPTIILMLYTCTIGVQFPVGAMMGFFFATASRQALRPTQPPTQWIQWSPIPAWEADHSPPSNAEVKNAWSCTSTPQ
jgi:hypothetical protein